MKFEDIKCFKLEELEEIITVLPFFKRFVLFLLATTQDNLDDKLRKFEIRDMMGLTDDRDISETVSETWSTDVLGSDFDPNIDEDRLQEIAGNCYCMSLEYCCLVLHVCHPSWRDLQCSDERGVCVSPNREAETAADS